MKNLVVHALRGEVVRGTETSCGADKTCTVDECCKEEEVTETPKCQGAVCFQEALINKETERYVAPNYENELPIAIGDDGDEDEDEDEDGDEDEGEKQCKKVPCPWKKV